MYLNRRELILVVLSKCSGRTLLQQVVVVQQDSHIIKNLVEFARWWMQYKVRNYSYFFLIRNHISVRRHLTFPLARTLRDVKPRLVQCRLYRRAYRSTAPYTRWRITKGIRISILLINSMTYIFSYIFNETRILNMHMRYAYHVNNRTGIFILTNVTCI